MGRVIRKYEQKNAQFIEPEVLTHSQCRRVLYVFDREWKAKAAYEGYAAEHKGLKDPLNKIFVQRFFELSWISVEDTPYMFQRRIELFNPTVVVLIGENPQELREKLKYDLGNLLIATPAQLSFQLQANKGD